jgi:A/G-specific adenine glycosylase
MENWRRSFAFFNKKLLRWYNAHHRELPWRNSRDPYKIWVSEVMLQQTTVKTVLPYYRKWIELFPDVTSLSRARPQKVLKAWQGLGYYQRAKSLLRASRIIIDKHQGQIPKNYQDLRKLPGLGPYTAAAVLSLAFGQPYPVLDANARRVLMRIIRLRGEVSSKNDRTLLQFLKPFFPKKNPGLFNQALMELGALVCRPKNPLCLLCPLCQSCVAFKKGEQEIIPSPKKRSYQRVDAVVAVIGKDGKYLIQKRPPSGLMADLWEFPGGKRKPGETLRGALRREVREELSAEVKEEKFILKVEHAYTQFLVSLHVYQCRLKNKPLLRKGRHLWVALRGLKNYPFPSGSAKIVKFLEDKEKYESNE